jgi:uncharacterized membrane protein YeaQ/YmgE (transglycosylase-associated protein family)
MDETPYRPPDAHLGADGTDLSARNRIALAAATFLPVSAFIDTWTYGTSASLLLDVLVPIAIGAMAVMWIGADETLRGRPTSFGLKVLAFLLPPIGILVYLGRSRKTRQSLQGAALFLAYVGAMFLITIATVMLGEYLRYGEFQSW